MKNVLLLGKPVELQPGPKLQKFLSKPILFSAV